MTALNSATATRMPLASVLAPAPLALGVPAEPRASIMTISTMPRAIGFGGCVGADAAAITPRGGAEGDHRFGGSARGGSCCDWYGKDWGQLAGGGPLRA